MQSANHKVLGSCILTVCGSRPRLLPSPPGATWLGRRSGHAGRREHYSRKLLGDSPALSLAESLESIQGDRPIPSVREMSLVFRGSCSRVSATYLRSCGGSGLCLRSVNGSRGYKASIFASHVPPPPARPTRPAKSPSSIPDQSDALRSTPLAALLLRSGAHVRRVRSAPVLVAPCHRRGLQVGLWVTENQDR